MSSESRLAPYRRRGRTWPAGAPASSAGVARRAVALAALGVVLAACGPVQERVAVVPREVCNGQDDDGNGVVDDLDANGDGLCDCLRIGVLGYPGPFGSGDRIQDWMHGRAVPTEILAGAELTRALLGRLDVLLVQDVRDGVADGTAGQEGVGKGIGRPFSDAEVQAVKAWVDEGGGLMTLTGYSARSGEVTNVNRLLAPFGLSYLEGQILNGGAGSPVAVTHWDPAHPIARGVTQVRANNGRAVSGGTRVAWEPSPGAADVGGAVASGRGHVFAWGDEWIGYDSEWIHSGLQVRQLWTNALDWLTVAGLCHVPVP